MTGIWYKTNHINCWGFIRRNRSMDYSAQGHYTRVWPGRDKPYTTVGTAWGFPDLPDRTIASHIEAEMCIAAVNAELASHHGGWHGE